MKILLEKMPENEDSFGKTRRKSGAKTKRKSRSRSNKK